MQIAQIEAAIPIKPTRLSPSNIFWKSKSVMLKMIKPKAIMTRVRVKIFIIIEMIFKEK